MLLIDGKATSNQIKEEIAAEVEQLKAAGKKVPHLAAVLVGEDGASQTYVNAKVKACEKIGFESTLIKLPSETTEQELLTKIDNHSIDMTEYKLFVCRAHNHNEIDLILKQIIEWRKLNYENKKQILERINNSDIFNLISGYASYSLSFFGKSTYTDISEIEDEKILYLKKNEYNEVQKILKIPKISNFEKDLDTQERFIEYYGSLPKKTQKPLVKNEIKKSNDNFKINFLSKITSNLNTDEKEKILLDRKIEDLFFLSGRTLNTLKNEQIIFLKDLLIWEEDNLKKMQGMGERSIRELKEQIHELNRKNYTNLKFFISKIESKITINSFEKEFVQDAKITMNTNVED